MLALHRGLAPTTSALIRRSAAASMPPVTRPSPGPRTPSAAGGTGSGDPRRGANRIRA
jgi:hypothetical protein